MKLFYGSFVEQVTLLCFYEELKEATLAGEKRPVAAALREAQLWLRDATLTDILSRVQASLLRSSRKTANIHSVFGGCVCAMCLTSRFFLILRGKNGEHKTQNISLALGCCRSPPCATLAARLCQPARAAVRYRETA